MTGQGVLDFAAAMRAIPNMNRHKQSGFAVEGGVPVISPKQPSALCGLHRKEATVFAIAVASFLF